MMFGKLLVVIRKPVPTLHSVREPSVLSNDSLMRVSIRFNVISVVGCVIVIGCSDVAISVQDKKRLSNVLGFLL